MRCSLMIITNDRYRPLRLVRWFGHPVLALWYCLVEMGPGRYALKWGRTAAELAVERDSNGWDTVRMDTQVYAQMQESWLATGGRTLPGLPY